MTSVFSTRLSRTGNAVDNFLTNGFSRPDKTERKVLIEKEFLLAGMPRPLFSIPLGWKLSCQARAFINDQLQPDKTIHKFIPCEPKEESMMKREPNRDRPLYDINDEFTKYISDEQQHLSYSIITLIEKFKKKIDPIYINPQLYKNPQPKSIILNLNSPLTPNK